MAKKNKPETQTNTEPAFKLNKIYLLARNPEGLIMPVECLEWILDLITSEKMPEPVKAPTSVF